MPFHPDIRSRQRADTIEPALDLTAECRLGAPPAQTFRSHAEPSRAPDPSRFCDDLLRLLPELRRFAGSITQAAEQADDLVQETLLNAWQSQDRYCPSRDLKSWIFAMMRNSFYSRGTKRSVNSPT